MKTIKLVGKERSVLRALDFSTGSTGQELQEATRMDPDELVGVLNGMITVGYIETVPYADETSMETYLTTQFDVNTGYAHDLIAAMRKTM